MERWYAMQIFSSSEKAIVEAIDNVAFEMVVEVCIFNPHYGLEDKPVDVSMKWNKRGSKGGQLFDGYMFVFIEENDVKVFADKLVMREKGITTFFLNSPVPDSQIDEAYLVALRIRRGEDKVEKTTINVSVDQACVVISGAFKDVECKVLKINKNRGTVTLSILVLGRYVSLEIPAEDVRMKDE